MPVRPTRSTRLDCQRPWRCPRGMDPRGAPRTEGRHGRIRTGVARVRAGCPQPLDDMAMRALHGAPPTRQACGSVGPRGLEPPPWRVRAACSASRAQALQRLGTAPSRGASSSYVTTSYFVCSQANNIFCSAGVSRLKTHPSRRPGEGRRRPSSGEINVPRSLCPPSGRDRSRGRPLPGLASPRPPLYRQAPREAVKARGGGNSTRAQMQKAGSSFREEPASARPFRLGRGSTHRSPGSSIAPGIGTAKALRLLLTRGAPRAIRQIPSAARMNPRDAARCGRQGHRGGDGGGVQFGGEEGHGGLE